MALKIRDAIFSARKPYRHNHLIEMAIDDGHTQPVRGVQGFMNDKGEFLTREEAYNEALKCEQIKDRSICGDLYSEDLW